MSLISDRMQWPYPAEDENPWYDTFQSLVVAMDASGYANREDRHRIISSDASVTFIASTGVLSWDAPINLVNAITGHKLTIPAGNVSLADSQMAYVVVTRGVLVDQNVTLTVATSVPNTDDAQVFCFRGGSSVYFIRGNRVSDGQSINPWAGGGGGGTDLSNVAPSPAAQVPAAGTSFAASRGDHVHPTLPIASRSAAGYLSAADKKRVDGVTYDFVADFGADPTGIVDVVPAWNSAMVFFWARNIQGGKLKIPTGSYKALSDLHVVAPVIIEGEGGGIISNTKIHLAAGARIIVDSFGSAQTAGYVNGQRGEFSSLRDFAVYGTVPPVWTAGNTPAVGDCVINTKYLGEFTQMIYRCVAVSGPSGSIEPTWTVRNEVHGYVSEGELVTDGGVTWKAISSPGLWMKGTAFLSNLYFESISGDAIYIYGYIANGGNPEGETATSGFRINECQAQECLGRGLYVEGTDSQGSNVVGMLVQNCNSGGIYDNSDVGNLYLGCLTETNGLNIWGPTGFTATLGSLVVPQVLTMDAQFNAGAVFYYKCISSGPTSGGAEPAWPTTIGATVVDGSATWQCAGHYTYGQSLKNRRAGLNGSIFIGCYEEPDQRLSEVDHPGMVIGSIGGQQTISRAMNALNLRNGRAMSSLTYISKENGSPRIRSTLGSQDGTSPVALEMQKIDGTADYQTLLGESGLGGEAWFKICAGQIAYWLTAENAPEGPGRAVFFNGLHLGSGFGNTTPGAAMRLWAISQSNSQVLPAGANRGDFIFNRDAGAGQPIGWQCTTGGHPSGAVWTPVEIGGGGGTGLPPGWINVRDFGAVGNADIKTTGSITNGSTLLTVADPTGFVVGCYVTVKGAGPLGQIGPMLYDAKILNIAGAVFTLSKSATVTVVGAEVQVDDWPAFHAALQTMNHPLHQQPNYIGPFAYGTRLYVPPGEIVTEAEESAGNFTGFHAYRMSRQLDIDHCCIIEGTQALSTTLLFDDGGNGVVDWSNNNEPSGGSGNFAQIRNLTIKGPSKVSNPPSISGGFYGPQREAATTYAYGDTVSANTYARNLAGRAFKCIVAGTTQAGDETQPDFDNIPSRAGSIEPNTNSFKIYNPNNDTVLTGFSVGDWITVETWRYLQHTQITAVTITTDSGTGITTIIVTLASNVSIGIGPSYGNGSYASFRKCFVDGGVVWADIDAHGLLVYGKCRPEDCVITGFAGNGYACISSVPTAGNSNNAQVHTCLSTLNGGNGFYAHGNDANMILFLGVDAFQNGGFGIVDDSFLGNRYLACETDDNLRGSWWMTHGEIWGGYCEGGQGPVYLAVSATWLDGFSTEGFTGEHVPTWQPNTVYSIGDKVRPPTPNGYIYAIIHTPGTSGAVEPTWIPARGFQPNDNGLIWYCYEYDIVSEGYVRNGKISEPMEFSSRKPAHLLRLRAGRSDRSGTFFSWDSGQDAGNEFSIDEDAIGPGWQGLMWNHAIAAFGLATERAVGQFPSGGNAQFGGQLQLPRPIAIGASNDKTTYFWAWSGPPTTGSPSAWFWRPGSIVFNAEYTVGEPIGWYCTVGGTPGTWMPLGANIITYSPTTPGNWGLTAPANTGGALDSLAARNFRNIDDFGAAPIGQFQTTGTINSGSSVLSVASVTGLKPGMYMTVQGAGAANGLGGFLWHTARIISIDTINLTMVLDAAAVTSVVASVTRQDNSSAIQAAIDSFPGGAADAGRLLGSGGVYWCNSSIRIRRHGLVFEGASSESTQLIFPPGVPGVTVVSSLSADSGGNYGDAGYLRNLTIEANLPPVWSASINLTGDYYYCVRPSPVNGLCAVMVAFTGDGKTGLAEPAWTTTPGDLIVDNHVTWQMVKADGIRLYAGTYTLEDVREFGFSGDGIYIYGDPSGTPFSNSDLWLLRRCYFTQNQGHGVHVKGGAANAGNAIAVSSSANNFFGFLDESDLGNTYTGCHTESNAGSYKATSVNGPTLFVNCYIEGGQTGFLITGNGMVLGGVGNTDPASVGITMTNGYLQNGLLMLNDKSARGRKLTITKGGTLEQFLSFAMDDNNDTLEVQEEATSAGPSGYNTLTWYNTNGTCISIPFGLSSLRNLGLLVDHGFQLGQPGAANIRTYVDSASLTDGRRWAVGWECRNATPTVGSIDTTRCIRAGRGVPVWQAGHAYTAGDLVHSVINDGVSFTGEYFTCTVGGTSAGSEPVWSGTAGGATVVDGGVSWKRGAVLIPDWTATTTYAVGDRVKATAALTGNPLIMFCVLPGISGGGEPGWNGVDGSPNIDGQVIWIYENNALEAAAFEGRNSTAFTATTPGDWAGSPPTTVASALDRIAAALNALGHKA